ncbi:DinB family protein [Paraburkholderia sp. BCC1884]|uniref:DinB family protein n=1 Tax=Paraburkholderia sp. BCC1884 TaxID=2562668 RepID=UPI00118350D8|nr:DinB family protein [Paraburkholderia sp. BCC1884]
MLNAQSASLLARYKLWADSLLFDRMEALPNRELVRTRNTRFRSIIGTANHNYVVDLIWQAHLMQTAHGFTSKDIIVHPDLVDLRSAQHDINLWFESWADQQTDLSLAENLGFAYVSGQRSAMSRGAMFMHVVNHATYHRGWICERFFDIPATPPITDLPAYLDAMSNPA